MRINSLGQIEIYDNDLCVDCMFCMNECPLHEYVNGELVLPVYGNVIIESCGMYAKEDEEAPDVYSFAVMDEYNGEESEPLGFLDRVKIAIRVLFTGEV